MKKSSIFSVKLLLRCCYSQSPRTTQMQEQNTSNDTSANSSSFLLPPGCLFSQFFKSKAASKLLLFQNCFYSAINEIPLQKGHFIPLTTFFFKLLKANKKNNTPFNQQKWDLSTRDYAGLIKSNICQSTRA